jgi:hypothetical protein
MKKYIKKCWPILLIVFLTGFILPIPGLEAKNWNELYDLNEVKLENEISSFKQQLKESPGDIEPLKGLGIAYHIKATHDIKNYAPLAVEILTQAYEVNKKDNETLCYLGSATTMMAKTTWNPIKKVSYVNKGAAFMDKAIRRDPDNIAVRMTRGKNSRRLPYFLDRGRYALEDFEHLALLIEQNPNLPPSLKKDVYTNLAQLYEKANDTEKAERYKKLSENF